MKKQTNLSFFCLFSVGLLFIGYVFLQMNMLNTMGIFLETSLGWSKTQLGELSSLFFLVNVILLIPAALALDRMSLRLVILSSLGCTIIGAWLLLTTSFKCWLLGRFLMGIGSAFCFLGALKIMSSFFEPSRYPFLSGIISAFAMLGGLMAQTPLLLALHYFSLYKVLEANAVIGSLIWIWSFLWLSSPTSVTSSLSSSSFFQPFREAFSLLRNWCLGGYAAFQGWPYYLLGGLWGLLFLNQTQGFTNSESAWATTLLFLGGLISTPIIGRWVEHGLSARSAMIRGSCFCLATVLILQFVPHLSHWTVYVLMFFIGSAASTQSLSYALLVQQNPPERSASSCAVASVCAIGHSTIMLMLISYFIDLSAHHYLGFIASGAILITLSLCFAFIGAIVFLLGLSAKTGVQ